MAAAERKGRRGKSQVNENGIRGGSACHAGDLVPTDPEFAPGL
jgi:hypothetical protein